MYVSIKVVLLLLLFVVGHYYRRRRRKNEEPRSSKKKRERIKNRTTRTTCTCKFMTCIKEFAFESSLMLQLVSPPLVSLLWLQHFFPGFSNLLFDEFFV